MADDDLTGSGGCLCGAVRYEVRGPLREVIACHCGQCLRSHGNFAAYSATPDGQMTLTEDRGLAWYDSSAKARRGFCRECGSSLFWKPLGKDYIAISAGSFDQPSGLRLAGHIFVDHKPDFYEIADGLPQHGGSGMD